MRMSTIFIQNLIPHLFLQGIDEKVVNRIRELLNQLYKWDSYTAIHCTVVAKISHLIARESGSCKHLEKIYLAGLLHDIGKIETPASILKKKGKLTLEEYKIIKNHPIEGYKLISKFILEEEIIDSVLHHHEWINGNGYPFGLKSTEIPIGSKIIAVADAFHSMTSTRSYRKALDYQEAFGRIVCGGGSQFDQQIVHVFVQLFNRKLLPAMNKLDIK
jgi:putative nucleotidyltransferase with HDIG domain